MPATFLYLAYFQSLCSTWVPYHFSAFRKGIKKGKKRHNTTVELSATSSGSCQFLIFGIITSVRFGEGVWCKLPQPVLILWEKKTGMLEAKGLNRHHQENHCLNNLTLIFLTVFYLHFSSCHSDLGKSCSCCDQWWFLIYFNSLAYRLLLSRRSGGLLSIVFITIYDPLNSKEKLTRLICTSMQGKDHHFL